MEIISSNTTFFIFIFRRYMFRSNTFFYETLKIKVKILYYLEFKIL
jgi:hypothetical protein